MDTNNKNLPLLIGGIVLAVIVVIAMTSSRNGTQQPAELPMEANTTETTNEVADTEPAAAEPKEVETDKMAVKEFALDGTNFAYSVKELKVKEGDTVKITLNVVEGMHDWKVDEFDAKTEVVTAGKTTTVTFVADKVGTFEYYCSVGSHRTMGMVGNLIVE